MGKKSRSKHLIGKVKNAKRYTVTFKSSIPDIEEPLIRLRDIGVQVESAQKFIGTAVVNANTSQLKQLKEMDEIAYISETGTMSVV